MQLEAATELMPRTSMIWVVDDDPDLRQMVGTYLLDQGYDVRSLSDVKQLEEIGRAHV